MTRKIEIQMGNAILNAMRHGKSWAKDNTRVESVGNNTAHVFLHGHWIAKIEDTNRSYKVSINLCGWNTSTTRSRLSFICRDFVPGCCGVGTKQGQASIRFMNNKPVNIDSDGWHVV